MNFRIESTGLTRTTGIIDEYEMESVMPDGVVLRGIIRIETSTFGDRTVNLYRLDDYVLDELFIGSYRIDANMIVRNVEVGSDSMFDLGHFTSIPVDVDLGSYIEKAERRPEEAYWACVRREWREMKEAYLNRPLDDIACDIISPACQVLALVAAAYECGK